MTAKRAIAATFSIFALTLSLWLPGPLQAGSAQDEEIKKLYALKCASCHALNGSGDTVKGKKLKARDLRSEEVQKMTDAELREIIAKGKKKMPGYDKKIGEAKVQQLTAYMRALAEVK